MIVYRTPTLSEAGALAELGRTSFVDAFGDLYSAEDLDQFLRETKSDAVMLEQLSDPRIVFRVAEREGDMVGFCKLVLDCSLDFDFGERSAMELANLYLRGSETGGGVGSALMDWAKLEAERHGYDLIALSVWQGNHAGQRFYRRHGFEWLADTVFIVGQQVDEEYLFALDMNASQSVNHSFTAAS